MVTLSLSSVSIFCFCSCCMATASSRLLFSRSVSCGQPEGVLHARPHTSQPLRIPSACFFRNRLCLIYSCTVCLSTIHSVHHKPNKIGPASKKSPKIDKKDVGEKNSKSPWPQTSSKHNDTFSRRANCQLVLQVTLNYHNMTCPKPALTVKRPTKLYHVPEPRFCSTACR